jgi:hypothetical protein
MFVAGRNCTPVPVGAFRYGPGLMFVAGGQDES